MFFVLYGAVILKISSTAPFLPREIAFTTFKTGTQTRTLIKDKVGNRRVLLPFLSTPTNTYSSKKTKKTKTWNDFQMTYSWLSKPWEPAGKARVVWNYAGFVWLSWQWHWELRSVEPSLQTFYLDKHTLKHRWTFREYLDVLSHLHRHKLNGRRKKKKRRKRKLLFFKKE